MGRVIAKQIRGMSWTAKISLVLLCTLLTSVLMYEGWYKPKGAEAAIAQLAAWSSVYNNTAYPGTNSYTVPAGDKRMLVVGITSTTSAAVTQTMTSVTYNGVAMTPAPNNDNGANATHSYLFYQPLGTSVSSTIGNIVVTMSGGTSSRTFVNAAVYSGVDQSAPIRDSKAFNIGATASSTVGPFATALTSATGDMAVEMINLTRTGSSSASSARTISTWSAGWSSALNSTAGVTSGTQYAIGVYAATRSTGTNTTSQHTASGSVLNSMAAMSIKAFSGPTVLLATPDNASPGATLDVTITGGNFVTGATANFGGGITVNNTTFNSPTSLTANISIIAGAAFGVRTVTVTNPDLTTGSADVFTVLSATAPTISTVSPAVLGQGATNVNVALTGTNYIDGGTPATSTQVAVSGTNVTVNSVTINSATSLTANLSVAGAATIGARDITTTNPDTSTYTKPGVLTITTKPTVTSAAPLNGSLGWTGNVTIAGTGFVNGAGLAASFSGTGITVNSTTYVSATSLTANITIDSAATGGARTITVQNPDFGTSTAAGSFIVVTTPAPTITSITPSAVGRGATNVPFTITGTNFDPSTTVTRSGTNVTLGTMTVQDSTTITGTIASVSGTGTSTITVTNPDTQTATSTLTLNTYPGAPSAITPSVGTTGKTFDVTVTSSGLVSGAMVSFSGTGITVNSNTYSSSTSITANITIDAAAATGTRSVIVTNPDFGTRSASNLFTVTSVGVNTASPAVGAGGTANVAITGQGFVSGTTSVAIGGGVTVNSVSVTDANNLTANVSVPGTAAAGTYDVTVTVGGSSATGTGLFTVTAPPVITSLSPATVPQGSTIDVTINGSNFANGCTVQLNGSGVALNNVTYVSSTQLTANVTVDANAAQVSQTVTVSNPDGGKATGGSLTVVQPANTVAGAISFNKVAANSMTVQVAYSYDGNNNNSCTIQWGVAAGSYSDSVIGTRANGVCSASINGLTQGSDGAGKPYYFQVTFSDPDGVTGTNPITGSQATRGSDLMHNSLNTFSDKWAQGWGVPGSKYEAFACSTCHSKATTNAKLVAGTFATPNGESWDSKGTNSLTITYTGSQADAINACVACHSAANYNNATTDHQLSTNCVSCHDHSEAFLPSCKTCHSTAQGANGYRRQVTGNGGDFFANMSTHGSAAALNSKACVACHASSTHRSYSDGVSVGLKNADTGAVVNYDGTAATAEATKGACISCHDADGATVMGANALTPFAASNDTSKPSNIAQYWPATGGAHSGNMMCFNCHGNSKGDGSTTKPYYNGHASGSGHMVQDKSFDVTNPNNYCFSCHKTASTDPNKSSIDIAGDMAKTYKHTTAKCFDCHGDEANSLDSAHSLRAGSHTPGSGTIANNISNATGRGMTWSGSNWGGANAATSLASGSSTAEFQVCFKCHAATGTGTTPTTPSGTAAASLTNLALEFNPNNKSGHPIVTGLNNYPNSAAPKALTAARMKAPWNVNLGTQTMTCSDCHDTDSTASKGPHGSAVKWMLAGTNKAWPYTTAAGNGGSAGTLIRPATYNTGDGTANGLFCLNCHTIRPASGGNSWHTNSDVTGGEHGSNAIVACASCHIRVPHGGKVSRLLLTTGAPGRYMSNGNGATASFDSWGSNANGAIKGSSMSSSNFNSSCSRHNSGAGETW